MCVIFISFICFFVGLWGITGGAGWEIVAPWGPPGPARDADLGGDCASKRAGRGRAESRERVMGERAKAMQCDGE